MIRGHSTMLRSAAWLLVVTLVVPLFAAGCTSGGSRSSVPPPVDDSRYGYGRGTYGAPVAPQQGMSMGRKMVILAGAAALYYMYKKHQNAAGEGPNGQYYLSRNGRVYYRDAQHRAHWVTPPPGGIQVPESEAQNYQHFQGYNNRSTGRDLSNLPEALPEGR